MSVLISHLSDLSVPVGVSQIKSSTFKRERDQKNRRKTCQSGWTEDKSSAYGVGQLVIFIK